jgi:iron complex outermembrane receptor protein
VEIGNVRWTPGIVLSHYQSKITKYVTARQGRADFGAPGQNGTNIIMVEEGKPVGQIYGPVFDHVSTGGADGASQVRDPKDATKGVAKGGAVFKDLNGDGEIHPLAADALDPKVADMKVLGTGIPTAEVGWTNRLTYKNWDFNVFFRGAFGHSLVNQFRGFYEPIDPGAINSYNRVTTKKAVPGLTEAKFSSLYVEKADFVKLDNITIGYNFKLHGKIKNLRLYATGQNLFMITGYTGIDPEPVLADQGASDNGAILNTLGSFNTVNGQPVGPDVLAPGIDRRNNYFTNRTFTFGLNLGF